MKSFIFEIQDKKLNYKIPINNKFTVISGLSATGKTTLVSLFNRTAKKIFGTKHNSPIPLAAVSARFDIAADELYKLKNNLIIMDEDCEILNPRNKEQMRLYSKMLKESENIFILITRNILDLALPENSYLEVITLKKKFHIAQPIKPKYNNL